MKAPTRHSLCFFVLRSARFLTQIYTCFSHADTGVLSLAPLKRTALGAHDPQPKSCPLPPFAEPLAEPAKSRLVVATEVVEPAAPLPTLDANNLAQGRVAPETDVTQATTKLLVEATTGCGDVWHRPPSRSRPCHRRLVDTKLRRRQRWKFQSLQRCRQEGTQ
jgi:hypothetical protein